MTKVLWKTFWRIGKHFRISVGNVLHCLFVSSPVNVVVHGHEDDAIFETFWLKVVFLHHVLDFL